MIQSNFFDLLKTVYTKQPLAVTDDDGMCVALTKSLSKDPSNAKAIRIASDYLFYIPARDYFYLLVCLIPKKSFVPKMIKVEKTEEKESKVLDRLQEVLSWSSREMDFNKKILDKVILEDEKSWKQELGVK